MLKKAAALFCVCASLMLWVSCGKTISRYVYAASPSGNRIVVYREDPNSGILTALVGSPYAAGPAVHPLALHPSGKFLYAANSGEGDVSLFKVSTGALTEVTPRTQVGITPLLMVMDPTGGFLYVGNAGSQSISAFSIDSTSGALTPTPQGSQFPLGVVPLDMKLAPSGNFLYVSGAGSPGFIEIITLTAGSPTSLSFVQPGTNPNGLAIDPSGTHLYAANPAPENSILMFPINSDGTLGQSTSYSGTLSSPVALTIDKSGKYLYVANAGANNLAAYAVGSDGGLTILSNSPFTTPSNPAFITGDPSGNFLFVGNQSSAAVIQSFSLDTANGTLTSVASYQIGGSLSSVAVSP